MWPWKKKSDGVNPPEVQLEMMIRHAELMDRVWKAKCELMKKIKEYEDKD